MLKLVRMTSGDSVIVSSGVAMTFGDNPLGRVSLECVAWLVE